MTSPSDRATGDGGRPRSRLASLDAFRGGTIALMLLVNEVGQEVFEASIDGSPGGRSWAELFPEQILHAYRTAPRHAMTLADVVFPWFMLIVGVSIVFSMSSGRGRGQPIRTRLISSAKRSAILYGLGCLIHAALVAPDKGVTWKLAFTSNVLTEIAFAYFLGVLLYHLPRSLRVAYLVAVLIGSWILLRCIPPPGGAPTMLDYLQAHARPVSSLLTFAGRSSLVIAGTLVGEFLVRASRDGRTTLRLLAPGLALSALALLWRPDQAFDPMHASSTFVLMSLGSGLVVLSALFYAIDVRQWTSAWMLRVLGLNPIAIYFTVEMLWPLWSRVTVPGPGGRRGLGVPLLRAGPEYLAPFLGPLPAAWLQAAVFLTLCWLAAAVLDRRRIYIKV